MKRIGLLLMVLLLCFFMTGCWNIREINSLAITICVGIDKTENGYRVTHQILNPKAIASKSPKDEPAVVLYVEEGKDIFEIYRRTTTQSPRKIYNSHMRMVIISEDVAREGLKKILDFFTRDHEFRTDFYFAIAKGVSANRLLSNLTVLESIPGIEMYNSMETSENAWAPVKSIKIVELVNDIIAEGKNPVLTAVELIDEESSATETKALTKSFVKSKPKFTMLGAFNNDKLAGWLNEDESKGFNYIMGNVRSTVGFVQLNENESVSLEVKRAKSKIKASMKEGKPEINVDISMFCNIGGVIGDMDVSKEESLKTISKLAEEKTAYMCNLAVIKAQKQFKTDIFGFGEAIHKAYPDIWKNIKEHWSDEFSNIPVNIEVEAKIDQLGQVTKCFFKKG